MPSRRRVVGSATPQAKLTNGSMNITATQARLVHLFDEVASWQRNPYILSGFRPESRSYKSCLHSLTYLHNQTVNIYSHGLAVPLIWGIAAFLYQHARENYPSAGWHDWLVFGFFFTGMTIGYGFSATFHCFSNHSEAAHGLWLRMDLLGIIIVIAGCFPAGLYYTFYCMDEAAKFEWIATAFWAQLVAACFVLLIPQFRTPQWSTVRAFFYVLLGVSAFLPIFTGTALHGVKHMREEAGGVYYLMAAMTYFTSATLYAKKWPERRWPGRFDIWGSSHQLFHVTVVIGLFFHLAAFISAFKYHHSAGKC